MLLKHPLIQKFPEYYLLILVLLSGYTPPFHFNALAVGLAVIILLQIIFKKQVMGIALTAILGLVTLLMVGALFFELTEFSSLNSEFWSLLLGGLLLSSINIFSLLVMFDKYISSQKSILNKA